MNNASFYSRGVIKTNRKPPKEYNCCAFNILWINHKCLHQLTHKGYLVQIIPTLHIAGTLLSRWYFIRFNKIVLQWPFQEKQSATSWISISQERWADPIDPLTWTHLLFCTGSLQGRLLLCGALWMFSQSEKILRRKRKQAVWEGSWIFRTLTSNDTSSCQQS